MEGSIARDRPILLLSLLSNTTLALYDPNKIADDGIGAKE